ncbi:MAG: hypothetical protein ABSH42_17480 [Bryobacteraceae bacterium]|jgi:hypothetical protein
MKICALFLFPLYLFGATGNSVPNAVSALARKAPPEFAADAMIRLASNEKLDSRTRVKLLTEAFRQAAGAQHQLKLRASITRAGGAGGFLERAYQQDLDALSLRLRAVQQMLPLDSAKASKLFLSMARPAVPPVRCEEIVVYDVSRYYEGLEAVSKAAHRDVAKLLKDRVGGITSPAQIAPVARLLQHAELKDADLEAFTLSLATSLREMSGDDRSFTYYATPTGPAILDLVEELKRRHLSPLPLIEAYRLYLVDHLTGDRCADDYLINKGPMTISLMTGQPTEVLGWNASVFFAEKILMPPGKPLSEQETTPHSLEGISPAAHTCQDVACQNVNQLMKALAFGPDGEPLLESQHHTDAWRTALQATLTALDAWQPAAGRGDEVFREKTWVYNNLYAMSAGVNRESVLRSWLNNLKQSRATVSDRAQWFLPVNALIGRVALDPGNTRLAELLRQQDDPVFALYVELERVAPRGPEKVLPLL